MADKDHIPGDGCRRTRYNDLTVLQGGRTGLADPATAGPMFANDT